MRFFIDSSLPGSGAQLKAPEAENFKIKTQKPT